LLCFSLMRRFVSCFCVVLQVVFCGLLCSALCGVLRVVLCCIVLLCCGMSCRVVLWRGAVLCRVVWCWVVSVAVLLRGVLCLVWCGVWHAVCCDVLFCSPV
jgi:hypothetical protein